MTTTRRLAALAGALLLGQGLLVVLGVLDHETPRPVAAILVAAGAGILFLARAREPVAAQAVPPLRRALVAALGATAVGGVLLYDVLTRSGLAAPEWAALAYGAGLLAAAGALHRPRVYAVVGWSLPLVAAPLGLWALEAALEAQVGAAPLAWYIERLLVAPMAAILGLFGVDARVVGDTVRVATPRGPLFLTVGVVCAGLYAMVVFSGVLALFAWERGTPPARLAVYLGLGLAGLHVANVLRLAALALVGRAWGGGALQAFHRHLGWVLFVAWSLAFWWLVLRRLEGPGKPRAA